MLLDSPEAQTLNSLKYLYLPGLSEPKENALRIVVQEAVGNPAGGSSADLSSKLPEIVKLLEGAVPIESTETCKTFEIVWTSYVAYLVTEECVGSCGSYDDEAYAGKLLRVYDKSHFLDHLMRDTGGHTATVNHYKLICLNHLIDVASYSPPEITCFAATENPEKPRAPRVH